MLDELLGRAALKKEIEALEAERDRLEKKLAAESDRRAEAVRERQAVEEELNRLEDRIAQLEGDLEREKEGDQTVEFRTTRELQGDRLRSVLNRIESVNAGTEGAFTAMIEDRPPAAGTDLLGERAALLSRAAPCLYFGDDAGVVSVALRPPVAPEPFSTWGEGFEVEREWFLPVGRFAVALVRADLFAIGEYQGERRMSVDGFESEVHSEHSKGGFSQSRFERRRDEQIENHLQRCRQAIEDRTADRLYVLGDREAIGEFDDLATETAPVDATGDPETALDAAVESFFSTRLYGI